MNKITGSCHCGAVGWEVTLPAKTVVKCHCGNCRKLQGSDYSTWVIVPSENHVISKGEDLVSTYQASEISRKHFCSKCGTAVYLKNGKNLPDDVVLALGTLDNYTEALAPQIQVYTPDKAPWVMLHEDEPIFS